MDIRGGEQGVHPCELIIAVYCLHVVRHSPTFTTALCADFTPTATFQGEFIAGFKCVLQRFAAFASFAKSLPAFSLRSWSFDNELD